MKKQDLKLGENKVTYLSEGKKISALVYVSKDYKEGEKRPAIVFTRPGSGVKEQTAGLYAKKLSEKGFVTLAFDPRGFGESEGTRQLENPFNIVDDTKNSVSFISTLEEVDANKVFNIGICMGAGYATYATAFDPRVKGVAMISPYLHASNLWFNVLGASGIRSSQNFQGLGFARQQDYGAEKLTTVQAVPPEGPALPIQVGMRTYYLNNDLEEEGYADHSNWVNALAAESTEYLLAFSVFDAVKFLDEVPFYMAVGKKAEAYPYALDFYNQVKGPKHIQEISEANHFDLYWKPEHVNPITEKIAAFFKKYAK